jgi:uncharacterized repeat protein (TIGR03803 family)
MQVMRRVLGLCLSALLFSACGGGSTSTSAGVVPIGAAERVAGLTPAVGFKMLYAFRGTPDGAKPLAGLVALNGRLYGTTLNGSSNYCSASCTNECYLGCGTVFSVDASGAEHVVYNFKGLFGSAHDGSWPFDGLTVLNGQLYGTTSSAGANSDGTVFSVSTGGTESVLYSFAGGSDGQGPEAGLTADSGTLYGTTVYGGGSGCGGAGCGTVFSVTTSGHESVIYSFQGGSDGERVYAPVTVVGRKLYGATLEGGSGCGSTGCGTIFELSKHGKKHLLHTFAGASDGAYPNGLIAVNGVLYGTTEGGGTRNSGTFFSITPAGTLTTLYNFQDIPDGNLPGASLIYTGGRFYGTTVGGGTAGDGTVFKVTKDGKEKAIFSFTGSDGSAPQGPVYLFNGKLYSTTSTGGATATSCESTGCGTIFRVRP